MKEPQGQCLVHVLTSNKQTKQLVKQQTKSYNVLEVRVMRIAAGSCRCSLSSLLKGVS